MAPTLYERIWDAVNREPRINQPLEAAVTHDVNHVEVFNTYAAEINGNSQEGHDSPEPGVVEAPQVDEAAVLEKAAHGIPHHRLGGGQTVARAGHQDGDRINSLQAQVTAIQATVAADPQQARDMAHFVRFANDAIRVHSGAK